MIFDLTETDDQRQILDAAQMMLDESYPVERLRCRSEKDDLSPIADFGGFALALPEESGGAGFTLVEEALLHTRIGHHLVSSSSIAAPIASRIAIDSGHPELATEITAGNIEVAAAVQNQSDLLLLDSRTAQFAMVHLEGKLQLLDLSGIGRVPVEAMGNTPIQQVKKPATQSNTYVAKADTARICQVLVAAQLLGVAEATRDLAVEYAKTREQFGRAIGSFQAIKHHCANMAIRTEKLSALLDMAAITVRDSQDDADFQVAALSRIAPGIALENSRACIQIHGGIGFSAEADAHLFLKHAHLLAQLIDQQNMLEAKSPMASITKET